MYLIIDTAKIAAVFCFIDDCCLAGKAYFKSHPLPAGLQQRHPAGHKPLLSESEVRTILVLYHLSGFKCFLYYQERLVPGDKKLFALCRLQSPIFGAGVAGLLPAFLPAHPGHSLKTDHY